MYFPKICEMKLALQQWSTYANELIQKMAKSMLSKFDKYQGVVHEIMSVATILDLRYKMEFLEFYYEKLYDYEVFFSN